MTNLKVSDNEVINYLTVNPDFFARHPELLETLKVNNRNGNVTSLVNHQVNILRDRNNNLKIKLSELINFAEENERLMSQVFELSLQICQISHVVNITKHFSKFVKKSFDSDFFKIIIPEHESLESSKAVLCIEHASEFLVLFGDFMGDNTPICGRLRKNKLKFIFGENADEIGSCVMLPIGLCAEKGILVFASKDENRFNPEMSTDLLSKLTNILERKFKNTFESVKDAKIK